MNKPPDYMGTPEFALLHRACQAAPRAKVALLLGVSAPVISQVLNASGAYGSGKASTKKLWIKVAGKYGHWACPHLTEQGDGSPQVIDAARCRDLAHRAVPTGSPRDLAHWQACRKCAHFTPTAPPVPRPVVPRKPRITPPVPTPVNPPALETSAP